MMKSLAKRILGVIVCASLVLGTVTLPTLADNSVSIPTGQNTWQDDDPPASPDGGTQYDPDSGLPIDTDPVTDDGFDTDGTDGSGNAAGEDPDGSTPADNGGTGGDDAAATDGLTEDDGTAGILGGPEIGIQAEGDAPATELEAAKRISISPTIQPEILSTGASANLAFTMSYNNAGGAIQIDPAKLRATVTIPKEITTAVVDSDHYSIESTGSNEAGDTVITLVFNLVPEGGAGSSFDVIALTTPTGTIADGSACNVTIHWTYDADELMPDQTCSFTNKADKFGWDSLRGASNPSSVTAVGTHVPDMTVQYSLNNAAMSESIGRAFTKSIEIVDTITVNEKIIVTQAMLDALVWTYNGVELPGGAAEALSTYDSGYIQEFRVKNTIANESLGGASPADLGNVSNAIKLTIKDLRVNKEKANTGSLSMVNISDALSSSSLIANIYPCVSSSSSSLNSENNGEMYQELSAADRFSASVTYYWTEYEPEDPTDPAQSGRIEKHVKSVTDTDGNTHTNDDRLLYAWNGDRVTYKLENFGNYLEEKTLENFVVTDEFSLEEMYPISLTPGAYLNASGTYTVRAYIKEGNNEGVVCEGSYNAGSDYSTTTIDLRTVKGNVNTGIGSDYYNKNLDVTKISKIEFDYSGLTVAPNFRASPGKGPTITTFIRNRNIPNPDPETGETNETLTNTASVSYACEGTTYNYDGLTPEQQEIEYNFRSENEIIYYQKSVVKNGSKSFIKIRGNNATSTTVETGDLLEYTVTFTNNTEEYARDPFIDDKYGAGLKPYIEDRAPYNLKFSGYEEPFVTLVSVIDEAGRDVTAARDLEFQKVYVGPIEYGDPAHPGAYVYEVGSPPEKEPYIGGNMMRIRFKSNSGPGGLNANDPVPAGYIHPGDVITVSYIMEVTDPSAISNEFTAYGYPIYTGRNHLIEFDGGKNEGGKPEKNPYLPTVGLTQVVTRDTGTGSPTSSSYPVEEGELLNVKLTLQNSDLRNAPSLTLYGFASRLENTYNEVFKYVTGDVVVNIYKNSTDTVPVDTRALTLEAPAAGFYNNNATYINTYKQRAAFIFRDGQNAAPITLNPSARVELTFQVESEGWARDDAQTLRQILYTHALFKDINGTYNSSNSRGGCSNYITGVTGTYSHIYTSSTIYVAKRKVPIARAWVTSSNYLALNNLPEGSRPERTGTNSHGVQIQNVGKVDLPITKIYVKLPENERFIGLVPYKASSNQYAANHYKADVLGIFEDGRQVVALTPTSEHSKVLKPNRYAGRPDTNNSNNLIGIETYVENATAAQMIAARKGVPTFEDSQIEMAFYSEGVEVLPDMTTTSNRITALPEAEKELWGGGAMQADTGKGALNKSLAVNAKYSAYYPLPGVTLSPLRKFINQGQTEYKDPGAIAFSPNENMAWRVNASLDSGSQYLQELKDAVAVLKLPASMNYTGIVESGFEGAQSYTGSDGYLYVVVPLAPLKASASKTFTVTATLGSRFGGQTAEVFLLGSDQFYNARQNMGSILATPELDTDIRGRLNMTPGANMVKNTANINVSGMFAFDSEKTVSVPDGEAIDRGMKAPSRYGQVLTYTLTLSNQSPTISYTGLTIIDRLPVPGDKFVLVDETNRGSTTKVTMKSTPVVSTAPSGGSGSWTPVSDTAYTVQYADLGAQAATYAFTNADFGLPDDGAPSQEAGWINAADWPEGKQATAFRIIMDDPLPKETAIRVTYDADAPEEDMPKQNAVAVNSFAAGFQAQIGDFTHKIKPEPDYAQVIFPELKPMIIEGTLFTEPDESVNGIYEPPGDSPFTDYNYGTMDLLLFFADNPEGNNKKQIKKVNMTNNSDYKFDELYDEGYYFVEISGKPRDYVIYEELVDHQQGNKFDAKTLRTAAITYEEGITVRRNADFLKPLKGTLTLHKTLPGGFAQVGGKDQKFVFRIEYTPHETAQEDNPPMVFYEVLGGGESKKIIDLPRGTYVVTEVAGWATGFEQMGGTAYLDGNNTVDRQTPHIEATCENQYENRSFMHAIGEAINNFNEKAPTYPKPQ